MDPGGVEELWGRERVAPHSSSLSFWVEFGPHWELYPADHAGTLRVFTVVRSCPSPGPQLPRNEPL